MVQGLESSWNAGGNILYTNVLPAKIPKSKERYIEFNEPFDKVQHNTFTGVYGKDVQFVGGQFPICIPFLVFNFEKTWEIVTE